MPDTFRLREPYQSRPIRCLEIWHVDDWRIKVYGIAYGRALPNEALMAAGKAVAQHTLPQPAFTDNRYGVGYLGVHEGRGVNFVFVDWFADENEIHHRVFTGPTDNPSRLVPTSVEQSTACVWDLRVMAFERQAWLDTVLLNPQGPDLAAYLACQLNEEI